MTFDSLLLVLPVPFRRDASGALTLESQACNGLERWAENFDRIVVACPVVPEEHWARGDQACSVSAQMAQRVG